MHSIPSIWGCLSMFLAHHYSVSLSRLPLVHSQPKSATPWLIALSTSAPASASDCTRQRHFKLHTFPSSDSHFIRVLNQNRWNSERETQRSQETLAELCIELVQQELEKAEV